MTGYRLSLTTLLFALVGCRGTEAPAGPMPLCVSQVAGDQAQEVAAGDIPPEIWFSIVLRGYDRASGELRRPVNNCMNRAVEPSFDETYRSCLDKGRTQELPARPLTEEDLVIAETSDGRQLIWVMTHHFENGEAMGPIALATWTERGVAINSMGTLRTFAERANLRLEPFGSAEVLVVESRVCDPDHPKKCERVVRMMPHLHRTFEDVPLVDETGQCLGPAAFRLSREKMVRTPDGVDRSFELTTTIDFDTGSVVVSEQMNIDDRDPDDPEAPPQSFRKANSRRQLQLLNGAILTKPGLWRPMLQEFGSVRVEELETEAY